MHVVIDTPTIKQHTSQQKGYQKPVTCEMQKIIRKKMQCVILEIRCISSMSWESQNLTYIFHWEFPKNNHFFVTRVKKTWEINQPKLDHFGYKNGNSQVLNKL